MPAPELKELVWIASSLRDLRGFPEEVRQVMGFALFQAQTGGSTSLRSLCRDSAAPERSR
jgi:phage-related protein